VGFTNPEGFLSPELRRFLLEAFAANFISRDMTFSRVLKSLFTVEKRPMSCWSLALNSVIFTAMEETSVAAGAAASTTGAAAGVRVTSLTGAAASATTFLEVLALAGAGAAVAAGAVVVVLDALTILACIYYISVIYLSKFPAIYINCPFNN
jgi:hypothetical protein